MVQKILCYFDHKHHNPLHRHFWKNSDWNLEFNQKSSWLHLKPKIQETAIFLPKAMVQKIIGYLHHKYHNPPHQHFWNQICKGNICKSNTFLLHKGANYIQVHFWNILLEVIIKFHYRLQLNQSCYHIIVVKNKCQ